MSKTFAQLVGGVQDRLVDGDGTGAGTADVRWTLTEKRQAVNYAIERFCRESEFLRSTVTWTQDSGAVYKPGSSVKVLRMLELPRSATLGWRLLPMTEDELFAMDPDYETTAGDALYFVFPYAVVGDVKKMLVAPVPSSAHTDLKNQCVIVPADLSGSDAGVTPSEYDEGLIDGASAYLLKKAGQTEYDSLAGALEANFREAIARATIVAATGHTNQGASVRYRRV